MKDPKSIIDAGGLIATWVAWSADVLSVLVSLAALTWYIIRFIEWRRAKARETAANPSKD